MGEDEGKSVPESQLFCVLMLCVAEPAQGRAGLATLHPPEAIPWPLGKCLGGEQMGEQSGLAAGRGNCCSHPAPVLGPCPGAHPVPRLSSVSKRRTGDHFLVTSEASHAQPS